MPPLLIGVAMRRTWPVRERAMSACSMRVAPEIGGVRAGQKRADVAVAVRLLAEEDEALQVVATNAVLEHHTVRRQIGHAALGEQGRFGEDGAVRELRDGAEVVLGSEGR